MSKGSNQRPKAVDDETFRSNWESTFGVKPQGNSTDDSRAMKSMSVDNYSVLHRDEEVEDLVTVSSFNSATVPAARPIEPGETFQVYADPWPFKTVEELAEAMNGQQ